MKLFLIWFGIIFAISLLWGKLTINGIKLYGLSRVKAMFICSIILSVIMTMVNIGVLTVTVNLNLHQVILFLIWFVIIFTMNYLFLETYIKEVQVYGLLRTVIIVVFSVILAIIITMFIIGILTILNLNAYLFIINLLLILATIVYFFKNS